MRRQINEQKINVYIYTYIYIYTHIHTHTKYTNTYIKTRNKRLGRQPTK